MSYPVAAAVEFTKIRTGLCCSSPKLIVRTIEGDGNQSDVQAESPSVVIAEVMVGLVVAFIVAILVATVPTAFLWMVALRRVKTVERIERGQICPCGYDLAGLARESVCPECGQPPEASSLRERFNLEFRPCGRLHLFIACLPMLLTGFVASAGLESGYLRMGIQPSLAVRCASEDDRPGPLICMGGVGLLGATAALTRRATASKQTLVLLVSLSVWCFAVFIGYSLDAHRRGLDVTWGLLPGISALPMVSVAIVLICAGREFLGESRQAAHFDQDQDEALARPSGRLD